MNNVSAVNNYFTDLILLSSRPVVRCAAVALPIVAPILGKPISFLSRMHGVVDAAQKSNRDCGIWSKCWKVSLGVASLGATAVAYRLGLAVNAVQDLGTILAEMRSNRSLENGLRLINQVAYGSTFFSASRSVLVGSLAIQMILEAHQMRKTWKKDQNLWSFEMAAHAITLFARGYLAVHQINLMKFEAAEMAKEAARKTEEFFSQIDGKRVVVVLETNLGKIQLLLFPKEAPKATMNFIGLADQHYYDRTTFHRVIQDFMIQGGDPKGNGTGGESIWKAPFKDEFSPDLTFDQPNLLAMANRGPNTNGSQFFITRAPTPWLNQHHTIFGKVIEGQDVVQMIEKVPVDANARPIDPPVILKAYSVVDKI
jgi:peptidylprolyl isomerase